VYSNVEVKVYNDEEKKENKKENKNKDKVK
jgi:hypothetical protein